MSAAWTTTRRADARMLLGILLAWPALCATAQERPAGERDADRHVPRAVRAAVERVLPSLVTIESYGGTLGAPSPTLAPPGGPARRRPRTVSGVQRPGEGPTTGLIISPEGHVLTSTFNFLRRPAVITVVLRDGTQHVAKLLGRDDTRRLCVLKIEGVADLPVPETAPLERLQVGQWTVSLGVGYGADEPAISVGIVSALDRIYGRAVQTDANISPANYGGPLLDIEGRVIGLCVPLSPRLDDEMAGVEWYDSGVGFAVPLDGLGPLIERLKAGETIRPGRLGIGYDLAAVPGAGVPVSRVLHGSPAAKAGLRAGDVILAVQGVRLIDAMALRNRLGRLHAGDEVTLLLRRGQTEMTLKATLDEPPAAARPVQPSPAPETPPGENLPAPRPEG